MKNDLPAETGHHWARTTAGLALVATSILFVVANSPAHAAAATHLTLDNVDKAVTKGEDNSFFLAARDANGAKDPSYTGEITFTAFDANGPCNDCAQIRTGPAAAPITSYTFDGSEGGRRELFVRWLKTGSGFRLDATGPVQDGTDTASARDITVSAASGTTTTTSSTTTTILPTTTTTTPTSTTSSTSTSTTTPVSTTTTLLATTSTTLSTLAGCDNPSASAATVTPPSAPAGTSVTMRGKCMAPNATVTVKLDTTTVGTTTADAFGQFATILAIPTRTSAGAHTLSAAGAGGKGGTHTASATITVTASSGGTLSRTGADSGRQGLAGITLLAVGFLFVAVARKPRGEHF
jgi:hypothetical protein